MVRSTVDSMDKPPHGPQTQVGIVGEYVDQDRLSQDEKRVARGFSRGQCVDQAADFRLAHAASKTGLSPAAPGQIITTPAGAFAVVDEAFRHHSEAVGQPRPRVFGCGDRRDGGQNEGGKQKWKRF